MSSRKSMQVRMRSLLCCSDESTLQLGQIANAYTLLLPLCCRAKVVTAEVQPARDVIPQQFTLSLCRLGPSSHADVAFRAAPATNSCCVCGMHVQGPMPMLLLPCCHAKVVASWVWSARVTTPLQFTLNMYELAPSSNAEVAIRAAPAKHSRRVCKIYA